MCLNVGTSTSQGEYQVVAFADLRSAQPQLWHEAALDLRTASVLHDDTSDEIHANGVRALDDNWYDALGDLAKADLRKLADKFRNLGLLDAGAASALDTLEDAIKIAQRELNNAIYAAESKGLVVSQDGRVSLPSDTSGLDVELLEFYRQNAQRLIDDAVEAATQADDAGRSALEELRVDPDRHPHGPGAGTAGRCCPRCGFDDAEPASGRIDA